jgi:hypothetical protein
LNPTNNLFDPHPPDPTKDEAPLAGGANVSDPNFHPKSTTASLPMLPPTRRYAAVGTSKATADRTAGGSARLRVRVLDYITAQADPCATDVETQSAINTPLQAEMPLRRERAPLRFVRNCAQRRSMPSGRPAGMWVAVKTDVAEGGLP